MNLMKVSVILVAVIFLAAGCGKKQEEGRKAASPEQAAKEQKGTTTEKPVQPGTATQPVPSQTEPAAETPKELPALGTAPNFELKKLDGTVLKLTDLRGKVVLIDFWATWCPPCRKMIPELKTLYDKYKGQGFEIVGVSLDEGGTDTVKSFIDNVNINYPVVIGTRDVTREYGYINAIPTSFIIDQKGNIRDKHTGYRSLTEMEEVVKNLLANK